MGDNVSQRLSPCSDEVIVLNATGTAAVISLRYLEADGFGGMSGLPRSLRDPMTLSLDRKDFEQQQQQQQLMQQGGGVQQALTKVQACKDGHTGSQVSPSAMTPLPSISCSMCYCTCCVLMSVH